MVVMGQNKFNIFSLVNIVIGFHFAKKALSPNPKIIIS